MSDNSTQRFQNNSIVRFSFVGMFYCFCQIFVFVSKKMSVVFVIFQTG